MLALKELESTGVWRREACKREFTGRERRGGSREKERERRGGSLERERERRGGCFEKERVKGKFVLRKSSKSLEEMIPYRWRFRLVRFK